MVNLTPIAHGMHSPSKENEENPYKAEGEMFSDKTLAHVYLNTVNPAQSVCTKKLDFLADLILSTERLPESVAPQSAVRKVRMHRDVTRIKQLLKKQQLNKKIKNLKTDLTFLSNLNDLIRYDTVSLKNERNKLENQLRFQGGFGVQN